MYSQRHASPYNRALNSVVLGAILQKYKVWCDVDCMSSNSQFH